MPAMMMHRRLAERVLAVIDGDVERDAFFLGAQGPDVFFFFRAYPWLPGDNGLPLGNALHESQPSMLFDAMRSIADEAPLPYRRVLLSYVLGFCCHYAVDRTMHPFVCSRQQVLADQFPDYAFEDNPYHYRYESALDTWILRREDDVAVSRFSLRTVIPKRERLRDEALAWFYAGLLRRVLGENVPASKLRHLTADMRHSMWLMTDHTGLKRRMFRVWERLTRRGAWYSALVRTDHIDEFDYANEGHDVWSWGTVTSRDDVATLCEQAVALSVALIGRYRHGAAGMTLTDDIDFAGCRFHKGEDE